MPAPTIVYDLRGGDSEIVARASCPQCRHVLGLDQEQLRGEVSLDCPMCGYHETHDLREQLD